MLALKSTLHGKLNCKALKNESQMIILTSSYQEAAFFKESIKLRMHNMQWRERGEGGGKYT